MLEFVLKEPRPSIMCINEHTLKNLNFSVLQILFLIDLRKYNKFIFEILIFDFHELYTLIIKVKKKKCNESKIYESFTFWNKLQKNNFFNIL